MAGEWRIAPLSDLTDPDTPVTYGVVKPGPEDADGVLFIRGGDIVGGRVLVEQLRTITREVSHQYRRTQLRGGEIVVSLVGNPGQVAIVPDALKGANIARQVGLVRLRNSVDARFVKYFLSSPKGQEALGAHSLGSVQQVINLRDLKTVPVPVPSFQEQRAIAHILGTLDDKIELLRRQNETLEAMARALFKAWFVDFAPVRAKMEGRWQRGQSLPGLPAHLYDLFPDRLVESELGEIPEGWEMRTVGDFADLQGGKQLEKDRIVPNGEIPVFGGAGVMGYTDTYNADGFVIAVGRVGAYCGQFFSHRGKAWINNNASLIRQKKEDFGEWLFLSLRHADIDVIKKGAAQPFVSNGDLSKLPLVWPSEKVVESFLQFTVPLLKGQEDANRESKFLALLRDTLLPKLISGELRIADAEDFLKGRG
jgi:type I restriction enzyme S subunit